MVLSLLLLFAAPYSIAHELYSQTASLKAISQTASLKAIRSARSRVGGSTPALCASAGRHDASKDASVPSDLGRRAALSRAAAAGVSTLLPGAAQAEITKDSEWPLWLALPVAPYSRRKTIRRAVGPGVWAFEQLLGIYYVHVPIRMTVVSMSSGGLFVYAPVAPTRECLALLQPLIEQYGPVRYIVLPSVAVEHKVNAGPFARQFPSAEFYALDQQYSFPLPLPSLFLGLPRWTKPLPRSSAALAGEQLFGGEFDWEVLTIKPGPGSYFQDVAFAHRPSRTLLLCDALLAVTAEPPPILTSDPEYTRALLFHARDEPLEVVTDSPEARRKGWRRIVLLFNFFIPGATQVPPPHLPPPPRPPPRL